jgi:DNA-directed RNA polymerase subunit beta
LVEENTKKKTLFSKKINIGIMPLMTPYGSFIINGVERVIISQIVRSYGIFYGKKDLKYSCKLIPERGPRLEMFIEKSGVIMARVNKSRKFPITSLLRVLGIETNEGLRELFHGTYEEEDVNHIELTLEKDTTTDASDAALFIYNKIRPGELIDADSAADYIKTQFLSSDRIDLGRIARRKINAKIGINKPLDDASSQLFDGMDMVAAITYLSNIANNKKGYYVDDSDHLSNKRIRTMGEILHARLQPIMRRFTKSIKGKLSILNTDDPVKLTSLANFKIIDNAIKSFFATSQLSQFLDQINPLAEIEHKRRITALGPGGLKKQTAKFEVRDVHPSHYGRICPIQTPEGQNIGLVLYQAMYSTVNTEGFLETPALSIFHTATPRDILNKIARKDIYAVDNNGKPTKKVLVKEDHYIDEDAALAIQQSYDEKATIAVRPYVTGAIEYISPEMDEKYIIADASSPMDKYGNITTKRVAGRHFVEMEMFHVSDITHIDVTPSQIFSANTGLIPFVNHNYDVRANVASNQQRQALPLLRNEAPLVGTGLEGPMLRMTHAAIVADGDGEVIYVDGKRIKIKYGKDVKEYTLTTFSKSNQKSVIHQKPTVTLGDKVKKDDLIAEGPSADNGELAIGVNLKIAFLPWE